MKEYYESEHDVNEPTTSALTAGRARSWRSYGFTGEEIGVVRRQRSTLLGSTSSCR